MGMVTQREKLAPWNFCVGLRYQSLKMKKLKPAPVSTARRGEAFHRLFGSEGAGNTAWTKDWGRRSLAGTLALPSSPLTPSPLFFTKLDPVPGPLLYCSLGLCSTVPLASALFPHDLWALPKGHLLRKASQPQDPNLRCRGQWQVVSLGKLHGTLPSTQ